MSTKADQSSSAPSKVSLVFGKPKSGFVIPKNKLSGSLIPVFKPGAKNGSGNKEQSDNQCQRNTKWNSDFTLDPLVRKTRALAYQTRLDQVNKLLLKRTTGEDATGEDDASHAGSENKQLDRESQEQLQLERREIIGEILNLNPSFKPPADYKPLLKEAKVPIPIKAHPGHNFIQILLGSESKIQKRLQDEMGAKIRVHAIKKQTGEKCEITQAEISERQNAYEEMHIDVFAETYNKLDAAVALLELLLTQATSSPAQVSSSTTRIFVDPNSTNVAQLPSYPSHWAPPPGPNSPSVRPYQYIPYTGQPPPVKVKPHHQSLLLQHGPDPHRPPYHEPMLRGPPVYPPVQATRMATHSPATPNPAPMRPPRPLPNNFSYHPNGPQTPYRPVTQNGPKQFGFQTGPPSHHGFQYPRPQMGPFGYPSGPYNVGSGQVWNGSTQPDSGGGMGRNFRPRAPLGPGGNNNSSNNNNNNQYYDPLLPTSGPVRPRKEGKVEADPEYEDLMASVGVK